MAALSKSQEISIMVDLLPENEQTLAYELIRRLVLAWDGDFTKLTPGERRQLEEAEQDFITGNTVNHNDIDWD